MADKTGTQRQHLKIHTTYHNNHIIMKMAVTVHVGHHSQMQLQLQLSNNVLNDNNSFIYFSISLLNYLFVYLFIYTSSYGLFIYVCYCYYNCCICCYLEIKVCIISHAFTTIIISSSFSSCFDDNILIISTLVKNQKKERDR